MNLPVTLRGYHWSQAVLQTTPDDGVFYLALNMTSGCNFRCPYCFIGHAHLEISPDEMTFDQKASVIRQAKACGARVVVMPGRGEPLADPDFWSILDLCTGLDMWVVVYTNGSHLTPDKIRRLKDSNISIYMKVDTFDREIYEEMVGKKFIFDRVMHNLEQLVEHFHEPVVEGDRIISRLGINSVVTTQSAAGIPQIDEWCADRNIFYTCRSPVKVGQADITWDYLVGSEVKKLREIGRKYATRNFTSGTEAGQCGIYRFGITVENTGEIYVCPDAREGFGFIGNVKTTSLKDLIQKRATMFPLVDEPQYCFVKARRNPEEKRAD